MSKINKTREGIIDEAIVLISMRKQGISMDNSFVERSLDRLQNLVESHCSYNNINLANMGNNLRTWRNW